jgi:hypothetical protein
MSQNQRHGRQRRIGEDMLRAVRSRLTYANVVATGALFVALGGGAYALNGVPDRSGVFHGCVSNAMGVLRVVTSASSCQKAKTVRRNGKKVRLPGEFAVAWNQKGAAGMTGAGGAQGPPGAPGADFAANSTLRPGETLTGVWAIAGGASANAPDAIQFAPQLPTNLGAGAVHQLAPGGTSAACPGLGQAARGHLCVYERASAFATFNVISNPEGSGNGATRRGAVIQYTTSASNGYADGTWAVTAP